MRTSIKDLCGKREDCKKSQDRCNNLKRINEYALDYSKRLDLLNQTMPRIGDV